MSSNDRSAREARFEQLYRATAKDLLTFLTRRTSRPDAATDLLAEVYLVAWRRLDRVPTGDESKLWLFGVARNLVMKGAEQERTHQALVRDLTQELARLAAYEPETTDPVLAERIRDGLDRLPAKQREVLLLTAWEGLKPREIAKVTGSTANSVRVQLHHARQALARELERPSEVRDQDDTPRKPLRSTPEL
jgi:RNA polymerase sigma-70 factor, ECF subfamily